MGPIDEFDEFEDELEESSDVDEKGMVIQNIDFVFLVIDSFHASRMGISEFHPQIIRCCRSSSNSSLLCRFMGMSSHSVFGFDCGWVMASVLPDAVLSSRDDSR